MADLVPLSEFVSIPVVGNKDYKISIKKFVESKGVPFKVGNGFYELSKPEIIQLNKTILVQRISAPENLIKGSASIRKVLKIPESKKKDVRFMVSDEILKEFKIFVQSTSYNRNLIGGTTFLYRRDADGGPSSSTVITSTPDAGADDGPVPPKRSRVTRCVTDPPVTSAATPVVPSSTTAPPGAVTGKLN